MVKMTLDEFIEILRSSEKYANFELDYPEDNLILVEDGERLGTTYLTRIDKDRLLYVVSLEEMKKGIDSLIEEFVDSLPYGFSAYIEKEDLAKDALIDESGMILQDLREMAVKEYPIIFTVIGLEKTKYNDEDYIIIEME